MLTQLDPKIREFQRQIFNCFKFPSLLTIQLGFLGSLKMSESEIYCDSRLIVEQGNAMVLLRTNHFPSVYLLDSSFVLLSKHELGVCSNLRMQE